MKAIFDINKVNPVDLNGEPLVPADRNQVIGNLLFKRALTIEHDQIARNIHAGKVAEVTSQDIDYMISVLSEAPIYYYFKSALIDYLNELK